MKKPVIENFYLNDDRIELDHAAWNKAQGEYKEFLAKKAEANRLYRERRTNREKKAAQEAAALRANRGLDPTREEWLMRAAKLILKHVAELGFEPTGEVKVALGVPPQKGRKVKTLGVCYHSTASEAAYREIFIHPEMTDSRKLLGVLTHEIGHAVLKDGVGHRAPFKKFCEAVGFDFSESGKAEHANSGADFWKWAQHIAEDLGPIPHKKLNCDQAQGQKKKQKTRMLLLECGCCGSKVRTAKATLEAIFEDTGDYNAQCINPHCDTPIEFEDLLKEVDEEGDEE